jgi:hypothetical protein
VTNLTILPFLLYLEKFTFMPFGTIYKYLFLIVMITSLAAISCNSSKTRPKSSQATEAPGPHVIIYKTLKDYANNVPVSLNAQGTAIVSYPAPKDLSINGVLATPTQLENGFLLDNKGIGPTVAFLGITYDKYINLKKTPDADELFNMVIDKDPLLVMYDCGSKHNFTNTVQELNDLIRESDFSTLTKIK